MHSLPIVERGDGGLLARKVLEAGQLPLRISGASAEGASLADVPLVETLSAIVLADAETDGDQLCNVPPIVAK